jgi:cbb3-type cytochrome oxidase maturation protein
MDCAMGVIVILILASLGVAGVFLGVFVWASRSGQFDDTTTPPLRMLTDDPPPARPSSSASVPSKTNTP